MSQLTGSNHTALAVASALMLTVSSGGALADGTSGFSAANAAMLRGYTASPGQLYIHNAPYRDAAVAGTVANPRRPVPARAR